MGTTKGTKGTKDGASCIAREKPQLAVAVNWGGGLWLVRGSYDRPMGRWEPRKARKMERAALREKPELAVAVNRGGGLWLATYCSMWRAARLTGT